MEFNWDVDESEEDAQPVYHEPSDPSPKRRYRFLIILAVLSLLVAAIGGGFTWFLNREDQRLEERVQAVLDLQSEAIQSGDGTLFFAGFDQNSDFKLDMLNPQTIQFWQNGPQIQAIELNGNELWVSAISQIDGEDRVRLLFLDNSTGTPILRSDSSQFWGRLEERTPEWGTMQLRAADLKFEAEITKAINDVLDRHCGDPCTIQTIVVSKDGSSIPTPNITLIPSPHSYGLDLNGEPLPSYWRHVESRIKDTLRLQPLTVLVPQSDEPTYLALRQTYEFAHPQRNIEILTYDLDQPLPAEVFQEADVVIYKPALKDILSGNVLNLTPLIIDSYDDFGSDVYAQLWASPWWEDRIWFVPLSAELPLIYLDSNVFNKAEIPFPDPVAWNWDSFEQVTGDLKSSGELDYGLVSFDPDILYARAYQFGNRCRRPVTVWCDIFLDQDEVLDAYQFYSANQERIFFPTQGSREERMLEFTKSASISTGETGMWVSTPILYESYLDSRKARVLAFPATDFSAGVSPLKVEGAVISAHSEGPISAREWINFMTHQPTIISGREIPLRPSLAEGTAFWTRFPEPLGSVTRNAFSASRPIRLGDEIYFDLEILEKVGNGELTPEEGLNAAQNPTWFGN